MSRTWRTPRPWDYRWYGRERYDAYLHWCAQHGREPTWTYKPWQNHYLTWGSARQYEYRLAKRLLRRLTRETLARQVTFLTCVCRTRWTCPLHAPLPEDTPDWHPGVVRVGYWD